MPRIPWLRDRYGLVYIAERKLTRVGNTTGVLIPLTWANDNGVNIGDKVHVRIESAAARKKRKTARRAVKPKASNSADAELKAMLAMTPTLPAQPQYNRVGP